ncbi:MAG: ribulose-phosphate 3-epimerase [Acholeplasmataceae bacterium]|nr:ribulose-phosphate 3-epimerase [Acholeplasmataceae bacterium]
MKIAPSVLTADFSNLKNELESIKTADYIHLDIMDGHFVPNLSFGPAITEQISMQTQLPLDIHLMVTNPLMWIDSFSKSNPKFITIHVESNQVSETIDRIKEKNIELGLSIKPNTSVESLLPYIDQAKLILIMTVEPGFGGQSFISEMMLKVEELVKIRKQRNLSFEIEVDGGINDQTIALCKAAGVDIAVAGSYLFNMEDRKKGIESLK